MKFKPSRTYSETNKKKIRANPCVICKKLQTDPCHIKSKGAGGGDDLWNMVAMCRKHHIYQHHVGWAKFIATYPEVRHILYLKGWDFIDGKLYHPELTKRN